MRTLYHPGPLTRYPGPLSDVPPADGEQHKLDRLLELRAVIDTLRSPRGVELLARLGVRSDRWRQT